MAVAQREKTIAEDVHHHEATQAPAVAWTLRDAGVRAMTALPLATRSGTPLGLRTLHHRRAHRPDARSMRLLDPLAPQPAAIVAQDESGAASRAR